jgi:hypothetical protein
MPAEAMHEKANGAAQIIANLTRIREKLKRAKEFF